MARLLVIDNYDSFTYNIVQMFMQYDLDIHVHRNDKITLDQAKAYNPDYILISPGPRNPARAGISKPLIKAHYKKIPILGVCLGMQCINEVFGGKTVRSENPVHGKTSMVFHTGEHLFSNIRSPFTAARYHSLLCELSTTTDGGNPLGITAQTEDGIPMGISHRTCPLHGVQFHPESFLTESGYDLVENFLALGPLASVKRDEHTGINKPVFRGVPAGASAETAEACY